MSSYTSTAESPLSSGQCPEPAFHHRALFHAGADEFLQATVPFVSEAVEREEPVLVAVTRPRRRDLEHELGDLAAFVQFADMEALGRNPARIIPAWQRFVDVHAGPTRPVRGIGEPVWRGRSEAELAECRRHEALLNLAFADAPAWDLLCPYDTTALDEHTLQAACHTHPHLCDGNGAPRVSERYLPPHEAPAPFSGELPEPDAAAFEMRFERERLAVLRRVVAHQARAAGLAGDQTSDLVLSVNELATNSISYGGGRGTLRIWRSGETLVCEVRDEGRLEDPLAGRHQPAPTQLSGRGLWLAHQLCDLVQVRSLTGVQAPSWDSLPPYDDGGRLCAQAPASGTVVRVHMRAR
jgi:anti-sigma regulatory factor (Ser/Thr protein kinase)